MYVCTYIRSFVHSFVRLFVRSFVVSFVRSFVRLYVCMYVYVCICMYVCVFPSSLSGNVGKPIYQYRGLICYATGRRRGVIVSQEDIIVWYTRVVARKKLIATSIEKGIWQTSFLLFCFLPLVLSQSPRQLTNYTSTYTNRRTSSRKRLALFPAHC